MQTINLSGLNIINTRPLKSDDSLNKALQASLATVLHYPTLEIYPKSLEWTAELPCLSSVHKAIFISPNAVFYTFKGLQEKKIHWPHSIHLCAVGQSTALALKKLHLIVKTVPAKADSENLLALPALQSVENQTILLLKGIGGRTLIQDTLSQRGAFVVSLNVYQRSLPKQNKLTEIEYWLNNQVADIILFTSEQGMRNFYSLCGHNKTIYTIPCLVISQRLFQVATSLGAKTIILSSIETIITTLHQFKQGFFYG